MKVILAVMCTTWAVVKIRPEKNSGLYGFEPMTSAIPNSLDCKTSTARNNSEF